MAIIANAPCTKCRKNGHDKTGDHLMIFDNGAGYCNRSHYHKNNKPFYKENARKVDGKVKPHSIDGTKQYSVQEFKAMEEQGIFKKHPDLRILALGGMKESQRWQVMTKKERKELQDKWDAEVRHLSGLSVRNLVSRDIRGEIAKLYDVRVGLNEKGKVDRHYYPVRDAETKEVMGAFCRNLPKDFRSGAMGKLWGEMLLFGQNTKKSVAKSGGRKDTLTITGGACDAMATQQMLLDAKDGTKWEGQLSHVWSVNRGETGIQEIQTNLKEVKKFKKVILAFDGDTEGQKMTQKVAQLLRDRAHVLVFPEGMKDPNQCLSEDREDEFVESWWNAEPYKGSSIKSIGDMWEEVTAEVTWGLSWPWPTMTKYTFGIRLNNLYTIGGGSGVGKTEVAKEVIQHLTDEHKELVGVIFMEEPYFTTARVIAGKYIGKKLHLPPCNDKKDPDYEIARDYTKEQADMALKRLRDDDMIRIADCKGDTSVDNIMELCDELRAIGCKYICLDNLTTMSHDGKEGSVKAIDESMKRIGTYVQEQPVSIFLLSHLSKPDDNRTPYEDGGFVRQGDFRGSQSIAFWSTFMIGVERNTNGEGDEKLITTLRCVKDRLTGVYTGQTVVAFGNPKTGRLRESEDHKKFRQSAQQTKGKRQGKIKKPEKKQRKKLSGAKEY